MILNTEIEGHNIEVEFIYVPAYNPMDTERLIQPEPESAEIQKVNLMIEGYVAAEISALLSSSIIENLEQQCITKYHSR